MQSMIKRKVDISITAHVELISQLVLDTYALHMDRYIEKGRQDAILFPGNFLYYRMSRQTGHTAALKKLLSKDFQKEADASVFGVFHRELEREAIFSPARELHTRNQYPVPEIDKNASTCVINNFQGTKISEANILLFSDTLHDPARMEIANNFVRQNAAVLHNLALVVFLG